MEWKETYCITFKSLWKCSILSCPRPEEDKAVHKSRKFIFIGYDEKTKAYRLLDPVAKKVIVCRDVKKQEDDAWDWNKTPEEETPISKLSRTSFDTPEEEELEENEPRNPRTRCLQDIYEHGYYYQVIILLRYPCLLIANS